jgi:hypothetical protein
MGDQPISPYQHVVTLGLSMEWHWLLIGLFFPLFPLSIGFNALLNATKAPWLKALLLLVWPQIGIALIIQHQATIPEWLQYWGLLSSGLYAFRMLAMREVNIWIGYLATSSWALLWIPAFDQLSEHQLQIFAFGFSLPLAIMALISGEIAKRYGAAYTGLYGGLAIANPRLTGVLVVSVFAAIATPIFPTFFAMLHTLVLSQPLPAIWLVMIWGTWSWCAARLLQGLIVGPANLPYPRDLSVGMTWAMSLLLGALAILGLIYTGNLS